MQGQKEDQEAEASKEGYVVAGGKLRITLTGQWLRPGAIGLCRCQHSSR